MPDEAQSILAPAPIDNGMKANAWQAFKDSANEREFGAKLQTMDLPQDIKANLWEAKRRAGTATPTAPSQQPINPALMGATQATGLSAAPAPTGIMGKIEQYAGNVQNDIRLGTETTGIGSILKKLGATGTSQGVPESVGNYMASPILGPAQMAQGAAQIHQPGKGWEGTKNIVGGALNTVQIPASFMAGPETEAATQAIPNAAKAGAKIQEIVTPLKDIKVPAFDANAAAMRAKEIFDTGGSSFPAPIRKFLLRIQNPERPPLTLAEARDFYMNATSLTAKEWSEFNKPMKAQLIEFTKSLGQNIGAAVDAAQPGAGAALRGALDDYHTAKTIARMGTKALGYLGKAALTAGAGGAGYAGYQAAKDVLGGR